MPSTKESPDGAGDFGEASSVPRGVNRADLWGWLATSAITAVVAVTWLPVLLARFGDNHLGRIQGRYALHVHNLMEKGLVGSAFSADWSPYSYENYAHHPPLQNMLDALFVFLFGESEFAIRLGPFILALITVPAAAALLRAFGIRWVPTLLAVGLMVATGFFWIYGSLKFDLGPILLLCALIVRLRQHSDPPRWMIISACVAASLTMVASWPGVAITFALMVWLLVARRIDRVTVAVGLSGLLGFAISVAFMAGVNGIDALSSQTEMRTSGGTFTAMGLLARLARFAVELLPIWYLVLFPLGVVAALLYRPTRIFILVSVIFYSGWMLVLNNGSFIHDYWGYLVLVPGVVGMGVLLDRASDRLRPKVTAVVSFATAAVLILGFASMVLGKTGQVYLYRPGDAGKLVAENAPAEGQRYAWHYWLSAPRWLAYYWDLSPRLVSLNSLTEEAQPDDLVVMDIGRMPDWLPDSIGSQAVATEGDYALFRVSDLLAAAKQ